MDMIAHLTTINGMKTYQSLFEHCTNTAKYAAQSVGGQKLYDIVYLAGLIHDAGKAKEEFVRYLEDAYQGKSVMRGSINHTFAGVIWLFENYHKEGSTPWERLTCEIIGYAVGSHHGMFDCVSVDGKNGFLHRLRTDRETLCYEEAIQNYLTQVADATVLDGHFRKAVQEVEEFFQTAKNTYGKNAAGKVFFQISMLVRLILSAVVYGDRRDTSEFMCGKRQEEKKERAWEWRRRYFEDKISRFDHSTALDHTRSEISMQCLKSAERPSGIYRLNVPTGAGKTLSTLRYALAHAERYAKKRIIFIIPLLSVLDQNAKVIRASLPDEDEVLEHHSNVLREIHRGEDMDPYRTLQESWDHPIVISTMVQLLDILFSDRISAVGRMQALCDSVIVIDEIQSLPKKTTVMFNLAMNFLQQYCNVSIVLSSATQPCFEELKWSLRLSKEPDLVKLDQEQFRVFKRAEVVDLTDPYGMDEGQCAGFLCEQMERYVSLLVICNTKNEARMLYEMLQELAKREDWDICHLSTAMCQEHRTYMLGRLEKNLAGLQQAVKKGIPVRRQICISTQLIEAGVDLSFACVVRILAGIDDLAQAAGRCNRSNEYGQSGRVYLINLKNEDLNMLREIRNAQNSTREVLVRWEQAKGSLIGEWATREFYRCLFEETKDEIKYPIEDHGEIIYLADLLSNRNDNTRETDKDLILHQPFKTVGKEFKVFDQDTIDVLTPYGEGAHLIEQIKAMEKRSFDIDRYKSLIQKARKYSVSLYKWQKEKLDEAGMLYPLLDGRVLSLLGKAYDEKLGLMISGEQAVEDYIL